MMVPVNAHRWLVDIAASPGGERVLYAFPHAGAGAAAVKRTCRALSDRFDTVAVRLPGRESRMDEEPVADLDHLTDRLAAQIADHAGRRRVFLYGHCAGAVIAYEVAKRLAPAQLEHLVVSANESPDRMPSTNAWRLPRDAFLAKVAADGYLPEEVLSEPELIELVEPALRADYRAIECHEFTLEAVEAPILALLGTEEHAVAVDDVAAWAALTSGGFRLERVPGGHNLLLSNASDVAAAIRTLAG